MRPGGSLSGEESEEGGHGWPSVHGRSAAGQCPSGKTIGWVSGAASELAGVLIRDAS